MKPNRFLRGFRRRLFACGLLAVILYLLQPGPLLIADEQDDIAKLSSLDKQVHELSQVGKFNEAIPIAQEFVELSKKAFGPDHPQNRHGLNDVAGTYRDTGDYAKAEPLCQREREIKEKSLAPAELVGETLADQPFKRRRKSCLISITLRKDQERP